MDCKEKKQHPKQFLALTSLQVEEFDRLLEAFDPHWMRYYRYHNLDGSHRKHPRTKEHGNASLQGTEQKLFFLLVYLKNNSLQEYHAAAFGVSQAKVSKIVKTLLEILNKTLKSMKLTPYRDGESLQTLLADHPDKIFSYDGTDRSIGRNVDQDAQEVEFSGKHHGHKVKNLLLCDNGQYIYYMSPTFPGSAHDKAICDEFPITLPPGSVLRQDLGFLGHLVDGVMVEQPHKTPRKGELTFAQKLFNKMFAGLRVVIEHANSGVKRLKIVKDKIRVHSTDFRDQVMLAACALHNFRVRSAGRAYA